MKLKKWLNLNTNCGFRGIDAAHGHEESVIESEYFDGNYQICLTDTGFVWLANGKETIGVESCELGERFPQDAKEIRKMLNLVMGSNQQNQ